MKLTERRQKELAQYYATLKRIAAYQQPEKLRKSAERDYGLSYLETLEMAYENVISEAAGAIHGKRNPAIKPRLVPSQNLRHDLPAGKNATGLERNTPGRDFSRGEK